MMFKKKIQKGAVKRRLIQISSFAATDGYVAGFIRGDIFKGASKQMCVPGLNCDSCPGAVGACPIGALQAVAGSKKHGFSFYVTGLLMVFAAVFGRFVCGFLCPFGFFQDLLHKIPLPGLKHPLTKKNRIKVPTRLDKILRYGKYIALFIPVFVLPALLKNRFGIGDPYFCKWVCPAGILEGAFPLMIKNESIRQAAGFLFGWKTLLLTVAVTLSLLIYRPFCKYLCPLGAFYALFNKISLYHMDVDTSKCTRCGACEKVCRMDVKVIEALRNGTFSGPFLAIDSAECIRCHDCKNACPHGAISSGWKKLKPMSAPACSACHGCSSNG